MQRILILHIKNSFTILIGHFFNSQIAKYYRELHLTNENVSKTYDVMRNLAVNIHMRKEDKYSLKYFVSDKNI